MRIVLLAMAAGSIMLSGTAAQAQYRDYGERLEKWAIFRAEAKRAREVGGYNDPITALCNLFSGNVTEKDFQENIISLEEARDILNEPQRPKYYQKD